MHLNNKVKQIPYFCLEQQGPFHWTHQQLHLDKTISQTLILYIIQAPVSLYAGSHFAYKS